jgi:hypothetical protein
MSNYYRSLIQTGSIVTNGLIYSLDFGNPICYSGSGLSAYDLISNDLFSINSNAIFSNNNGGSFNQNGATILGKSTNIPTQLLGNVDFTVSGWFKLNASYINGAAWGFGTGLIRENFNAFNTNQNEITISLTDVNVFGSNNYFSSSLWKHVVWTKKLGLFARVNCEIYINNIKTSNSNLTNIYNDETKTPNITQGGKIALGRANTDDVNNQKSNLIFSEFQIYNKVLTSTEVAQNYNNTKARYGY